MAVLSQSICVQYTYLLYMQRLNIALHVVCIMIFIVAASISLQLDGHLECRCRHRACRPIYSLF